MSTLRFPSHTLPLTPSLPGREGEGRRRRRMAGVSVLFFLFFFFPSFLNGQDTLPPQVESLLEQLAEKTGDEEADYAQLTELLKQYLSEPLHLNKASTSELEDLQILNTLQITALQLHIQKNGKLLSVYELQSIDGFETPLIRALFPFVTVNENLNTPKYSLKSVLYDGKHEIILRVSRVLEDQTGFSSIDSADLYNSINSRYIGDPNKLYARYRFTYGNKVSFGITAEKDPGEVFFKDNLQNDYPFYKDTLKPYLKNGFDFYSAHLFVRLSGFLKSVVIGDFQAGFGQGLVTMTGMAYGKSIDGVSIRRSAGGLKAHTGTDENRFLRGAGITLGKGPIELTAFFSHKKIDANITAYDTVTTDDALSFSSVQTSGYHTTLSELSDRKSLGETILGGNLSFIKRKFKAGFTALHTKYDAELASGSSLYNQYDFRGTSLMNIGLDYSLIVKNMNFFGEVAMSDNSGLAIVNGMMVAADPRVSFSLLHRYYQREYQGLFANGIGEGSSTNNEQGIYLGINMRLSKQYVLSGYYDKFIFPWLKYQLSAPTAGYEVTGQLTYSPSRKTELYIRYRTKEKPNDITSLGTDIPENINQENYRFNLSHQLSKSVKVKSRIEYVRRTDAYTGLKEDGFILAQDLIVRPLGAKYAFTMRYALFETDSYDTRVYAYENDLPGSYSIPAFYEKGTRAYVNFSYDITRHIEVYLRLSQTWYANKEVISEGALYEIKGDSKTEGKVMLRVKW